jgi:hypothetical protein
LVRGSALDHFDPFAVEDLFEGGAEFGVAVVNEEADALEEAAEVEVARLLSDPGARRFAGQLARWMRRLPSSMKNKT